jgi:hypothetical protein
LNEKVIRVTQLAPNNAVFLPAKASLAYERRDVELAFPAANPPRLSAE